MEKSPCRGAFFLPGNSAALLFVHGFGASPSEVYPTAAMLHETQGYTVSGVLLPGHGTAAQDLNQTNWRDWYQAVETELRRLQQNYEVSIIGLSMGGLLALHAGCHAEGIKAVAAINAPIFNSQPLLTVMAPVIQYIRPYYPKEMDISRNQLEEEGRFAYKVTPVKAFRSMMKLRRIVMGELDRLKAPLLVIQSLQDQSVKKESADYIIRHAIHARTALVQLPRSGHIATMGLEKDKIAEAIVNLHKQL